MAGILSLQFEPLINDFEGNLNKIKTLLEDFIEKNPDKKLDLVSFPEFFLTGVSRNYTDFPTDENGGEPLKFLAKLANRHGVNMACGTIIIKEGEKLYNTMFVLDRSGKTVAKYKKIHLFKYFGGTENVGITAGEYPPVVVPLDFGRLGLSICFDIRYPILYRKLAQMGAEIVISPSAWAYVKSVEGQKETNTDNFRAMNISRAFENLIYFVTSNQSGQASQGLETSVIQ